MLPEKYKWIAVEFEPEGDTRLLLGIAREVEADGNLHGAATALDRAYGIDPADAQVVAERRRVLDRLAVVEHGLTFRYVPGGMFLMGSDAGEADERPWHPVLLAPFWLAETPVSWPFFCRAMGWLPPPDAFPDGYERPAEGFDEWAFDLHNANKLRWHYCEDGPKQRGPRFRRGRRDAEGDEPEITYDTKPMTAVSWEQATDLAGRLSTAKVRYSLPSEAQWEKAARGGLIGKRYAWGDEPPTRGRCDFGHFGEFRIAPMKEFPPNGYGLYAMCGGVWEWARDWYDSAYYRESPDADPEGPPKGKEKVLRGGSWSDCAEAVTVTFRMALKVEPRRHNFGAYFNPNVGFRLCRTVRVAGA